MNPLFVLLFCWFFDSPSPEIKELRNLFPLISTSEKAMEGLKKLSTGKSHSPVHMAYSAAAEMASAQYKLNPLSKLSTFQKGKNQLEACIHSNAQNVEIRFIRFAIQTKAPAFLGYKNSISSDKLFLLSQLKSLRNTDSELYAKICSFLLLHGTLSPTEKELLSL